MSQTTSSKRVFNDNEYIEKKGRAGGGSYSVVYRGCLPTGEECAIKRNLKFPEHTFISSLRELDINNRLNHPNVISLLGVSDGNPFRQNMSPVPRKNRGVIDDGIHFIFPFAKCNLYELIMNPNEKFSDTRIKKLMVQILLGMEHIHKSGFIHRDVKPENILVFENDTVKIGDFGLSKPYHRYDYHTPGVMTSWYRAPEILLQTGDYTQVADMWSVGCVFHQIFSGKLISNDMALMGRDDDGKLLQAIINAMPYRIDRSAIERIVGKNRQLPFRVEYPKEVQNVDTFTCLKQTWATPPFENPGKGSYAGYKRVLMSLLEFDPKKRRTATEALDDPFFFAQREEIAGVREMYPADTTLPKEIIRDCEQRRIAMDTITTVYNNQEKHKWYEHKRLFQAINIFDRILSRMEPGRLGWTKEETLLYLTSYAISFHDIVERKYMTSEYIELVGKFEKAMIRGVLEFRIYQKTPFDILLEKKVPTTDDISSMLCMISYGHHNEMNAEEAYKYWHKNRDYYLENLPRGGIKRTR